MPVNTLNNEKTNNIQASRYAHEKFWPSCPQ
ncbi:MAG: hypothetical protein RJA83_110, partial [Pseudomonadota bacterium]